MSASLRTNVVLAGATGIPGRNILDSLQKCATNLNLHITILKCSSSVKAHVHGYPAEPLETASVDYEDAEKLASTLTSLSQAIVISALKAEPEPKLDNVLLTATVAAGEKLGKPLFFTNGFTNGFTLDVIHASATKYSEYLAPKIDFAKRLAREAERGKFGIARLVNAGFIDYGLMKGYTGIDLNGHEATWFDRGKKKLTGCSLKFVGDVVAEAVRLIFQVKGEQVKNRRLRVAEVQYIGQELLDTVKRVTGEEFEINEVSTEQLAEQGRVINVLNWNGEGAARFGDEGLSFGKNVLPRRTLKVSWKQLF